MMSHGSFLASSHYALETAGNVCYHPRSMNVARDLILRQIC